LEVGTKKYTTAACRAKVKGHEWMTVTFSKLVLYGNEIL